LYLHTATFGNLLSNARGLPDNTLFTDPSKLEVCDAIISDSPLSGAMQSEASKLCKAGILLEIDDDVYQFPSPLFERAYLLKRYEGKGNNIRNLESFILAVLRRIDTKQLKMALKAGGTHKHLESMWQDEFFRCAREELPREYTIVPNCGGKITQPVPGYPDFYINNNLCWIVEILREGIDMAEHARRFAPGGKYSVFLKKITAWVLIDFRSDKKVVRAKHKNMYHFCYNDNFSTFVVQQPNGATYPVTPYKTKVTKYKDVLSAPGDTPKDKTVL